MSRMEATRRAFLLSAPALGAAARAEAASRAGEGEFWRREALESIMPYWTRHAPDPVSGGFHTNLSREWNAAPPYDQVPLLIGRHAYGFSTAFQLSGDPAYLDVARSASEYLLAHAWDREYGGWYDLLDRAGSPLPDDKKVAHQIYVNAGLVAYYSATGDVRGLRRVLRSVELQRLRAHDPERGGWAETFSRDMRVTSWGKNKHAHYDYAGALLLNLHLATRDPSALAWARELLDLSLEKLRDGCGWFHGFGSRFDREWRRIPLIVNGRFVASTGAQLTAALALIRLFEQTGERRYLDAGVDLVERTQRFGWNERTGAWSEYVGACPPARVDAGPAVWWWVQIYGAMAQLRLRALTGEDAWLRRFRRSEEFFERAFRDREYGGVYSCVTPEGAVAGKGTKGSGWKASYHEMEHALVNYLYLSLYVNRKPAALHFRLDGPGRHFTSLVDDPACGIDGVRVNGRAWRDFDAAGGFVQLPEGRGWNVEVRLAPPVARVRKAPAERERVQQKMQLVMGAFPETVRVPLDVEIVEEVREPGYTRKKLLFTSEPDDRVPAYLLVPESGKRPFAAVVCLHPTHPAGKGVPTGLAADPGRNFAEELARRGYVTLAPDYPRFGDYKVDPYELGYASATAKGIWNHMRAIDLLASLPEVDSRRIAAAGHSLGGHNALFLAVFDPRVRAVVTSCGFTSFRKYMGGDLTGWSHAGYMPRIAAIYDKSPARMPFDFSDILRAIAPRPVFVNAPLMDSNFDASGVDDAVEAARAAGAQIVVRHPNAAHSFPDETRLEAYAFLDRVLDAAAPKQA
jgi:mannose/cellobiose epimerase-like protein (N-acyl-D-glucosamine 2-epimerase family)/dienelactone hydrolase